MNNNVEIEISENVNKKMLQAILEAYEKIDYENKKLALSTSDGIWMVKVSDIVRLEGDGNYTKIYFRNGNFLHISKTLKIFEALLVDYKFDRIHKSHLVNLHYIKRYYKNDGSYVLMEDDEKIAVSKSKRERLMLRLELL